MWFSFPRFFIIQGYTPLGHLCVLVVFIISLFAIFGLMWLFVSIFTSISQQHFLHQTFNKTILSWNAITSFSAILDNWEVPVCYWNTIGYSVCDLKRTEKLDHAEKSAFGSSSQKIDSFPGQHFTKGWSNIHGRSAPNVETMSLTWISKKLALPALTSKHCLCNLYQFSQYVNVFTYWCPVKLQPSISFALQSFQIYPEARHWSIQTLQCNDYCPF